MTQKIELFSDGLDKVMGWNGGYKEESCVRGAIHGYYHDRQGDKREKQGDHDGAKLERDRAQQQYDKCKPKK
ncbi:hypothetical protein I4U23_015829 [Adineta vaga]|nr:hypothetical protein I4U23_015829 [Adineta vaga]